MPTLEECEAQCLEWLSKIQERDHPYAEMWRKRASENEKFYGFKLSLEDMAELVRDIETLKGN